jgi:DNA excision repair protein ERCC-2
VRERAGAVGADGGDESVELCDFFETYERAGADALLPPGVYTVRPRHASGFACASH